MKETPYLPTLRSLTSDAERRLNPNLSTLPWKRISSYDYTDTQRLALILRSIVGVRRDHTATPLTLHENCHRMTRDALGIQGQRVYRSRCRNNRFLEFTATILRSPRNPVVYKAHLKHPIPCTHDRRVNGKNLSFKLINKHVHTAYCLGKEALSDGRRDSQPLSVNDERDLLYTYIDRTQIYTYSFRTGAKTVFPPTG